MTIRSAWIFALLAVLWTTPVAAAPRAIVLIGGIAAHKPGVHDGQGGVRVLADAVRRAPALRQMTVRAYPDGWPADPAAFDGAATIIWYFDGLEQHPLRDPARRALLARLAARGVGLVALHQAGTVLPEDGDLGLMKALGAVRAGMSDRTPVEVDTTLTPARHPVTRGIGAFTYHDEFYPTLAYADRGVTPVLSGSLRLEGAPQAPPTQRTVAWAFARPDGGRAFGFTGVHFLRVLEQPEVRQMVLNAIAWTAGMRVPRGGIRTEAGR